MEFLKVLDAFKGNQEEARSAILQQYSIWTLGRDITGGKKGEISMTDSLALPNASVVIPHVLSEFVREGVEPMLVGTRLLRRIQYQPGLSIQFPALGVLYAEDVGPMQSVPEFTPEFGGQVTNEIKVGRSGLAIKVSEDIIRFSQYNLVAYWLRLAGNALARLKEEKIFNFINRMGTVIFDNDTVANGITGAVTTGRRTDGTFNGAFTMDDFMQMYTIAIQQGFIPDTMLVHPLAWLMWLRDPVMRTFQLQYGGGAWWNMWQGNPQNTNPLAAFSPLGEGSGMNVNPPGVAATATPVEKLDQNITSKPNPPSYAGIAINIIISPFAPFNVTNNSTTLLMFNSQNLGALIVDQDPRMAEWTDPLLNIRKMQIDEKYGLAVLNEGQGIVSAKGIRCVRNYVTDESVTPSMSISGTLATPVGAAIS